MLVNFFYIKIIYWIFYHDSKFKCTLFLLADAEYPIVCIFFMDDFIFTVSDEWIFSLFPVFNYYKQWFRGAFCTRLFVNVCDHVWGGDFTSRIERQSRLVDKGVDTPLGSLGSILRAVTDRLHDHGHIVQLSECWFSFWKWDQ